MRGEAAFLDLGLSGVSASYAGLRRFKSGTGSTEHPVTYVRWPGELAVDPRVQTFNAFLRSFTEAAVAADRSRAEIAPISESLYLLFRMRIAIIGNNDGPERLAAALKLSQHQVVLVAQQIEARPRVPRVVENEQSLERALDGSDVDLVINCFANFKYRYLHRSYKILNIHLAPLPRYRGRHPLQWALINGETRYGVTIHEINDDWDDGPIYWQRMIDVREGWSARELREALFVHVEHDIVALLEELPTLEPIVNNASEGSYIPRRGPADSLIEDWADRGARLSENHGLAG